MNIKINIIKMSCYFAEDTLRKNFGDTIQIDDNEGGYTQEAQNLFDELYDEYYDEFIQFQITDETLIQ